MKEKVLLHSCCGPCSSYVIDYLINDYDLTVYFYNPNIEPKEEYEKRKQEQIKFIKNYKTNSNINLIDADYDNDLYTKNISGLEKEKEGGKRCSVCFNLRLNQTAIKAQELNFDYFATTLTVSPHKNSVIISKIGNELSDKYNIKYLDMNFKKNDGYKKSIELAKEYNLYRQNYCGCLYSKREN